MTTFKIVLRHSTRKGRHAGSLCLRVISGRCTNSISIGCYVYPDEWDAFDQSVIFPIGNPDRVVYLHGVMQRVALCCEKMSRVIATRERYGKYTVSDLCSDYHLAGDDSTLLGYAARLSADLLANGRRRTSKAYGTVCRGLVAFNDGDDLSLSDLTAPLINSFESYLMKQNKTPNTISYYMRNLRAIYNKAIRSGLICRVGNPFADVYTGVDDTRKRALSADEVKQIVDVDPAKMLGDSDSDPDPRKEAKVTKLTVARQLFIFCLFAHGMNFIDLCYLKKSQVVKGHIRYYRKKTGKQIEVPVNSGMLEIIKFFEPMVRDSEYVFPILKDNGTDLYVQYETAMRRQNYFLKELAVLAHLHVPLSTHVARHSWASIMKSRMQPISVISEGLGHSSEQTTRKYLASFDRDVLVRAGETVLAAVNRS